jgi:ribosomal protein S18 acetylase RimI-like enzyme
MTVHQLTDYDRIAAYLRQDVDLHLYSLGDLDPFYRPYTTWFGTLAGGQLTALALLYHGEDPPVLLGLHREPKALRRLLQQLLPDLPRVFYAHLSPGLEFVFTNTHRLTSHGKHLKMALRDPSALEDINTSGTIRLTPQDAERLTAFYQESYPGNWFNPRMLETGQYFGIERGGKLVCAAGVHVYSRAYRVAALGNIATRPELRGQGLATRATARCCRALLHRVDHVGLNLLAKNGPARACYRGLGFEKTASYGEFTIQQNPSKA